VSGDDRAPGGTPPRRLLILCYFFPPLAGGGVHRVLGFTRHLPARGWATTVVCAGEHDYWVTDPSLLGRVHPETEVVRVSGGSALSAWLSRRGGPRAAATGKRSGAWFGGLRALSDWVLLPDSYAGWARRAARTGLRLARERRFDAVLSTSPPDSVHLAGRAIARGAALPWVADFRDPWISLHFRGAPTAWHRARHAAMERSVIEGADIVLAASRSHADAMGEKSGARARRVVHLPNGWDAPSGTGPEANDAAGAADRPFRMVFTGTLSQMSDTEQFLDALHDMLAHRSEARRRIRVQLCGPYDVHYENRAVALGLSGIVSFTGPLGHGEARRLQRDADLLLLWKPRHGSTMVPGKTYEYLDSGRPVLALLASGDEAAALVRRAGGTIVEPDDRAAIAAAIAARYDAWRSGGRAAPARPAWLDEFSREVLAGRLASELDSLVQSRA
jgi:glycosyltransferase involved in cell wall biosynthesis